MSEIVLMKNLKGYGIYDTEEECFIGFRKREKPYQRSKNKIKSVWSEERHAKSAFKCNTGVYFNNQTRYEIREMK